MKKLQISDHTSRLTLPKQSSNWDSKVTARTCWQNGMVSKGIYMEGLVSTFASLLQKFMFELNWKVPQVVVVSLQFYSLGLLFLLMHQRALPHLWSMQWWLSYQQPPINPKTARSTTERRAIISDKSSLSTHFHTHTHTEPMVPTPRYLTSLYHSLFSSLSCQAYG